MTLTITHSNISATIQLMHTPLTPIRGSSQRFIPTQQTAKISPTIGAHFCNPMPYNPCTVSKVATITRKGIGASQRSKAMDGPKSAPYMIRIAKGAKAKVSNDTTADAAPAQRSTFFKNRTPSCSDATKRRLISG